jgi:xanthine dehydrogenase YagR molybdenum-binding subunit
MELTTTVNDEAQVLDVDGTESAVDVVRDRLGLTGTKLVCGSGVCGACTMLVDGEPVLGCLTPATRLRDASVTTVEGLADGDVLHPVQRAFNHHDGLQCGYCTPGQVCSAVGMLQEVADHHPSHVTDPHLDPDSEVLLSDDEIRERMSGNLCRCGAYVSIVDAIRDAAGQDADVQAVPR